MGGDPPLKADARTRGIPVVALTGHALAGTSEGAKTAGCDAFVTKPCLPEDLVKEIERNFSTVRRRPKSRSNPQERKTCENRRLAPDVPAEISAVVKDVPKGAVRKGGPGKASKASTPPNGR